MQWTDLKARLLSVGSTRITGKPAEMYIARSAAGPGACMRASRPAYGVVGGV